MDIEHEMDICGFIVRNFEKKEEGDVFISFEKELTVISLPFTKPSLLYRLFSSHHLFLPPSIFLHPFLPPSISLFLQVV